MAEIKKGVFGFEYLEDAELEQSDVVGCASAVKFLNRPIVCDIPRMPDLTGPITFDPSGPLAGGGFGV